MSSSDCKRVPCDMSRMASEALSHAQSSFCTTYDSIMYGFLFTRSRALVAERRGRAGKLVWSRKLEEG